MPHHRLHVVEHPAGCRRPPRHRFGAHAVSAILIPANAWPRNRRRTVVQSVRESSSAVNARVWGTFQQEIDEDIGEFLGCGVGRARANRIKFGPAGFGGCRIARPPPASCPGRSGRASRSSASSARQSFGHRRLSNPFLDNGGRRLHQLGDTLAPDLALGLQRLTIRLTKLRTCSIGVLLELGPQVYSGPPAVARAKRHASISQKGRLNDPLAAGLRH